MISEQVDKYGATEIKQSVRAGFLYVYGGLLDVLLPFSLPVEIKFLCFLNVDNK